MFSLNHTEYCCATSAIFSHEDARMYHTAKCYTIYSIIRSAMIVRSAISVRRASVLRRLILRACTSGKSRHSLPFL